MNKTKRKIFETSKETEVVKNETKSAAIAPTANQIETNPTVKNSIINNPKKAITQIKVIKLTSIFINFHKENLQHRFHLLFHMLHHQHLFYNIF